MPGIRIHHPTLRSCTFLMWDDAHIDPVTGDHVPVKCRPLLIDQDGNTIVSQKVWRRLVESGKTRGVNNEFIFVNEVRDPPRLLVSNRLPGKPVPTFEQEVRKALRQIVPQARTFTIAPSRQYRGDVARIAQKETSK